MALFENFEESYTDIKGRDELNLIRSITDREFWRKVKQFQKIYRVKSRVRFWYKKELS